MSRCKSAGPDSPASRALREANTRHVEYPLARNRNAYMRLPRDLTRAESGRLIKWLELIAESLPPEQPK